MRMPEPRSSRQLNQLATQLQGEAEISGVNASGTQISSRAFEMVTDFEPAGDQPQAIKKLVNGINSDHYYGAQQNASRSTIWWVQIVLP